MTDKEYSESIDRIMKKKDESLELLDQTYAMSNNTVECGDILIDHQQQGIVTGINVYLPIGKYTKCVYK